MQSTYRLRLDHHPRITANLNIGGTFTYNNTAKWFPGRTVRVVLEELQKADIGRKFARKDKRPLDPPPVIRLRCFEVFPSATGGTVEEEVQHYDDIVAFGLLCYVDLFPYPEAHSVIPDDAPSGLRGNSITQPGLSNPTYRLSDPRTQFASRGPEPVIPFGTLPPLPLDYDSSACFIERRPEVWNVRPKAAIDHTDFGNNLYPEESKCTGLLSGSTFIGCSLVDYGGSTSVMFAFSDLAVKLEGRYILRYRVFDIYATVWGNDVPVLAECYGGPFEIFSTKAFPGLRPSTDLTRRLSLAGVRVNSRTKERPGWKRTRSEDVYDDDDDAPSSAPQYFYGSDMNRGPRRKLSVDSDRPMSHDFQRNFSYAPPAEMFPGLGRSQSPPACLLAWARRNGELPDVSMNGNGDSYSTSTDDGSTHSLW